MRLVDFILCSFFLWFDSEILYIQYDKSERTSSYCIRWLHNLEQYYVFIFKSYSLVYLYQHNFSFLQVPRIWGEKECRDLFEKFGPVYQLNVLRDKATQLSRGWLLNLDNFFSYLFVLNLFDITCSCGKMLGCDFRYAVRLLPRSLQ